MERNELYIWTKTMISQKMSAEYKDKIIEFHHYIINVRKQKEFDLAQIRNGQGLSNFLCVL